MSLVLNRPFWKLNAKSIKPKNNKAPLATIVKNSPNLCPVKSPIAEIIKQVVIKPKSGRGKDRSCFKYHSVLSGFLFSTKKKKIQNPIIPIAKIICKIAIIISIIFIDGFPASILLKVRDTPR